MKLLDMFNVLRQEQSVADPATWKTRAAAVMAVGGLVMAVVQLAKAYGYDLHINEDNATAIAGAVVALVGVYSTYATSTKVGLLPAKRDLDSDMPSEVGSDGTGEPAPGPTTTDTNMPSGPN